MSVAVDPLFLTVARISTYDDPTIGKVWNYGTDSFIQIQRRNYFS